MNRVEVMGVAAACIALAVGQAVGAPQQGPTGKPASVAAVPAAVAVRPDSDPRAIAAQVAARPAGQRSLFLSGFDHDIALRDRVTLRAPAARAQPVSLPSPWLGAGPSAVQSRVAAWLGSFRKAGTDVEGVIVSVPSAQASSVLAASTFSSISILAGDKRFAALAAQDAAFQSSFRAGKPSAAAWQALIRLQVESASRQAHAAAVRASLGAVAMRVGAMPMVQVPQPPATGSPAGPVAGAGTPTAGTPTAGTPTVPVPIGASEASAIAAAASFVAQRGMQQAGGQSPLLASANSASEWDRLFGLARTDAEARRILEFAVSSADAIAAAHPSTFRRPSTFAEIPAGSVDSVALGAGSNRDARALSMSDCRQADTLRRDGVTLALAIRQANRPHHVARMNEILREVATWTPFQRPGWSLDSASRTLPAQGDGVNMATSWAIVGIVDILGILGDRVPADLRASLDGALRREVGNVVDSWVNARPWYVQSDTTVSNQWIDPNSAVVLACLHLRDDRLRPIYDMAAGNLRRSLDTLQPDGAFLEGMAYAQMSLPALFRAADAMARAGDPRLSDRPFTQNAWRWMLHMQMPGGNVVSSGDCRLSVLPNWATAAPLDSFALASVASRSPEAVPSLRSLFPSCGIWSSAASYASRIAGTAPRPAPSLDRWAYFPSQQMVTWREAWSRPGDSSREIGLWVKGGTLLERSHCHRDQGHLSVYSGSMPILMERGTCDYGDPSYRTEYASARGHGVMQIDPVEPPNAAVHAPLAVDRLGADGGQVRIDSTAAYRSTQRCLRTVAWDAAGSIRVSDDVALRQVQAAGTEFFRFHLGAASEPRVRQADGRWVVEWDAARVLLSADVPLEVAVFPSANALREPFVHHVLSVRAARPAGAMALSTEITVLR
jgi:hypothetical protein